MNAVEDTYFMQMAYEQALLAREKLEVPVGAVLVKNNNVVSKNHNQVISRNNPCAHAEILVLEDAGRILNNYRLNDTVMYVTLEPCAMCASALVHARVSRLVFSVRDLKAGAAGSAFNLLNSQSLNHRVMIDEGILEQPCSNILKAFFKEKR